MSASELKRLALDAGFVNVSVKGSVFYPPIGVAARLLRRIDRRVGLVTTIGAAFLALTGSLPGQALQCPRTRCTGPHGFAVAELQSGFSRYVS